MTDAQGRLVGILGKELRDAQTNRWLNYAQPIEEVREVIAALIAGKSAPDTEAAQLPVESASLRRRGVVVDQFITKKRVGGHKTQYFLLTTKGWHQSAE